MKRLLLLLLSAALLLSACAAPATPASELSAGSITFTDDLGREVSLDPPERVAALIGSFADIWCLAGGKDTLAAAAGDAWTSFDLELDESVRDLGAIKEPDLEVLFDTQPDLVLASCNTQADLELRETLEKVGIPVAYFDVQHFEDYLRMLEICTQLTGQPQRYETYGTVVSEEISAARDRQDGSAPTVLCIRATGSGCKVKGSENNLLGEMLRDLGCVNIADGSGLLEDLSMEAIIAADPDYIFAVLQGADAARARASLD
ncbi:MAG: ABC transporter substrate-binding protein, partial [Oscillibacter sp.]|nr:ABC transporter substrate-binding protein [Oscillibacter sp.]